MMRHLVYLMHADPSVGELYRNACDARGITADVVCVVAGVGSTAYRQLAAECLQGGSHLRGLVARYRPPRRDLDAYDTLIGASWSAGYGFWREVLAVGHDAHRLDGIVGLDSWCPNRWQLRRHRSRGRRTVAPCRGRTGC
jgi:hypothetical protein